MNNGKKCGYKYCIVPTCDNTSRNAPHKVFFFMPRGAAIRERWCKVMKRDSVSPISVLYCCEDHFNLPEDTKNYVQSKIVTSQGRKTKLRLKKGVLPRIYHYQRKSHEDENCALKRKTALLPHNLKQRTSVGSCLQTSSCQNEIYLEPGITAVSQKEVILDTDTGELYLLDMFHTPKQQSTSTTRFEDEFNESEAELSGVCRVCLAMDVKMYHLSEHDLSAVYARVTGVQINAEDKLPQHLCWECASRLSSANRFIVKAITTQRLLEEVDNSRFIGDIELIDRVQYKLDSTLGTKFHKANEYDYLFIEETVEAKNCNKRVSESGNRSGNHVTPTEFVVCKEEPREDITNGELRIKIEPVDINIEQDVEPFDNATIDAVRAAQTDSENANHEYQDAGIIIKKEFISDQVTGYSECTSELFEESQLIDKSSEGSEVTKQCTYRPLLKNQQITLNANKKRHKKQEFYKHIANADQSLKHMTRKMKIKTCKQIKTERSFEEDLDMDMEFLTDPQDTVKVPSSLAPSISNYVNTKGYG